MSPDHRWVTHNRFPTRRARGRRAALVCLVSGAVLLAEPFVYRGAAATQAANTGASGINVSLPSVQVTDPLGGNRSVSLGSITLSAQSDPTLAAALSLGSLAALGQTVPGVSYSSAQGTKSGNVTVPVNAGPVTGSVGLVNYLVQAANGTATAKLEALTGQLSAAPLGLSAALGPNGLASTVTPTGSSSTIGLTSPGLALKLSDILPANVLGQLPLGVLLNLLQGLHLQLPSTLGGALTQLENVVLGVQTLSTDLTNLANAQATVASLSGSNAAVTAAQSAVTAAEAAVTTAQTAVTTAQSKRTQDQATQSSDQSTVNTACLVPLSLACSTAQTALTAINGVVTTDQTNLTSAQSTLTTDQANLATAQAALTAAISAAAAPGSPLATAEGLVTTLTNTINGLLSQLQGILNGLPNLTSLLQQLTAALGNGPLLQVGNMAVALSSAANSHSGTGTVTCTLGSASVLGVAVAAPTCADLSRLLSGIDGQLAGVLGLLPSGVKPSVTIDGLQPTSQGSAAPSSTGATSASAGISALHLGIAPISLSGLVDSLTSQLQAQLQHVLSGLGLAAARAKAHSAAAPRALTLPAGLGSLLTTLSTQVTALPTGSALSGLSTLGLDAHLVGVTSNAAFQGGSATSTPAAPTSTTPTATSPTPTSPAPVSSAPAHTATPGHLAFTGANELGTVAAGLLLLVIGAQLLVYRRSEATATGRASG